MSVSPDEPTNTESSSTSFTTTNSSADEHIHPLGTGQREILDLIDQAKALDINADIDMPELGVFGDQSSGKSSVLEAITRIRFLVNDSLSTRFAIEFVLRNTRSDHVWSAKIIPDPGRNKVEKQRLEAFVPPDVEVHELGVITEAAAAAMGVDGIHQNFGRDVLRVAICGPGLPNLTLIDLPGIFHGRGHAQTEEDVEEVKRLVQSYMQKPRTIILAVIAADQELSSQVVTRWAQEVDPHGLRTMGIITKPDMLAEYPTRARQYIDVARNKVIHFGLGWHVLKNRKNSEINSSPAERDRVETAFLASGVWADIPRSQKGIANLLRRLSQLLRDHIIFEASPIATAFRNVLHEIDGHIQQLAPVSVAGDIKNELIQLSDPLTRLVDAAVSGTYSFPFFRKHIQNGQRHVELRRVIEELIAEYNRDMTLTGQTYSIVEDNPTPVGGAGRSVPQRVSRSEFMSMIAQRLELSTYPAGQFDSELASDLFYEQARPWAALTNMLVQNITKAIETCLFDIIGSSQASPTAEKIWHEIVDTGLQSLTAGLRAIAEREMKVYTDFHTIRFSRQIIDQVPKARHAELHRVLTEKMPTLLENGGLLQQAFARQSHLVQVATLSESVVEFLLRDVATTRYASAEIMHCCQEYYQVSLPKMLSKFDLVNFDDWILSKLPALFSPSVVETLPDDHLAKIGSDSADFASRRNELQNRRVEVEKMLEKLDRVLRTSKKRDISSVEEEDDI